MKFPKFSNKDWFNGAVIVCIGVTLFVLLSNISSVIAVLGRFIGFFRPVILGVIIAYIVSPLAKLFFYHLLARRPLPQFTSLTADRSELRSLRVNREGMNCLCMYLPLPVCERFTSSM